VHPQHTCSSQQAFGGSIWPNDADVLDTTQVTRMLQGQTTVTACVLQGGDQGRGSRGIARLHRAQGPASGCDGAC
jgi:hypothetical protein